MNNLNYYLDLDVDFHLIHEEMVYRSPNPMNCYDFSKADKTKMMK